MATLHTFPDGILPADFAAQVRALERAEYPTLAVETGAAPERGPLRLLLALDNEVISYLEIPTTRVQHAGHTYQASGLSSVLTDPAYRRQGYGRQIVTAAREYIAASGADIGIFTCDPPLVSFYVACGWTLMAQTTVVGGTRAQPFPAASLGKRTLMGFFSAQAREHLADFVDAAIFLDLGEGHLW